ncbi:MAG: aldo/keto reductase [Armatimonadetes bacterium]|nr:aldo/keto reductase [Armatimonadota bacterium]
MDDILSRPMPTRPLGRIPWQASVVGLGGVKWDTQLSEEGATALIRRAIDLGVNVIDTAFNYGGGESERRMGAALREGYRDRVFLCTKTMKRDRDNALRDIETSLARLRTETLDLVHVHGVDTEEEYQRIMAPDSVLQAIGEMRDAGHIRFMGVSGHWVRHVLARLVREVAFDAVLLPAGVFNLAYRYSFVDSVLPIARERGMAVLGMKVFGAGRVQHAAAMEPYLRYSLQQDIDCAIVGADSIAQIEQTIRVAKSDPVLLAPAEVEALLPEALEITNAWDDLEFNWVSHYVEVGEAPPV